MNREMYAKMLPVYGDPCIMCKGKNQPYMINNKVWSNTFKENKDVCCCLPCLEKKLNRKLNKADFKGHEDTLINLGIFGFDYRIYLSLP